MALRRLFRYSLATLVALQILLVLGLWLYFQYHRGSNYPLWVCGAAYAGLILALAAGWWLLPAILPGRSRPAGLILAGVAGCLAVAIIFPRLRPPLQVIQNPEYPTLEGLAEGSAEAQERQKTEAARLGLPVEIVNTVEMRFRFIPAGEFMMGSPEGETDHWEEDLHRVVLTTPFYLGATEVTQGQWREVMGKNPSYFQGQNLPAGVADADILPVAAVSWDDCQVFAKRLCEREWAPYGTYRLPTEAEWEYSCRAGTKAAFYAGDFDIPLTSNLEFPPLEPELYAIIWCGANAGEHPHPVAEKTANAWGLHDMSGNVSEWCADWFGEYGGPSKEPTTDPAGPETGAIRVLRGGSWASPVRSCRSADRAGGAQRDHNGFLGVRLVRTVEPRP